MICNVCGKENPDSSIYCDACGNLLRENEAPQICPLCNTENARDAAFCTHCGSALQSKEDQSIAEKSATSVSNISINRVIAKLTCIIGGLIGMVSGLHTMSSDKQDWLFGYNYEPPLTDHETGVIVLILFSFLALIVGLAISVHPSSNE